MFRTSGVAVAGCKSTMPSAHTASDGSHRWNQMWGPPMRVRMVDGPEAQALTG